MLIEMFSPMYTWMRTFIRDLHIRYAILVVIICTVYLVNASERYYTNEFAVKVTGGDEVADQLALKHGFVNHGQIGNLKGYYLFQHHGIKKRSLEYNHHHHGILKQEQSVLWVEQQYSRQRVKRDRVFSRPLYHYRDISDPLYREQWYLIGGGQDGYDMNVLPVWKAGISGKGVVVTILDDGIQTNHPDLIQNYDPLASSDINDKDNDPMPQDNGDNKHGTRCAGEVAATAFNNFCGVGIAYNASIGGVRMLDGTVTDEVEARALSLNPNHIDIYSASWGPEDDGKTVDGPGRLAKQAFIQGITTGRRGLGSIFVWASGNGGRYSDNCNCDGYTNSIYTLSISSATQGGLKPWYLEECSSTLATTYSSGTPGRDPSVVTVDMDMRYLEGLKNGRKANPFTLCTRSHTGTSASAPIAAAICALTLEANPRLTWRDMQYLVVLTSRPEPLLNEPGWQTNAVGHKVSHKFGYGLMDAEAMVELAKRWVTVDKQHVCYTPADNTERTIPNAHGEQLETSMYTDACSGRSNAIHYLEHVQVQISLYFVPRGNLHIKLVSPSGTSSSVLLPRPQDKEDGFLNNWPFLSVHFWGEKAAGKWKLIIKNDGTRRNSVPGKLQKWSLILYGTEKSPLIHSANNDRNYGHHFGSLIREISEHSANPCFEQENFLNTETGICVEECPEGHYENKTDLICSSCNFPCLNCYGPNVDNCLSCVKSYYLQEDHCTEECYEGFYKAKDTNECLPCTSQCGSCENHPSFCLSCKPGFYLFETHCQTECPLHTYPSSNKSCLSCHSNCETCKDLTDEDCTSCPVNWFLHKGQCIQECPELYFGDLESKECIKCDDGCKKCDQSKCISCIDGWQLHDDYCKETCKLGKCLEDTQCHETCKKCTGPTNSDCIECDTTRYFYNRQCVESCPDGYFGNLHKHCQLCHASCLKCTGNKMGQCETCVQGFVLHGGNCLSDCPIGLYKTNTGICKQCEKSCKTCVDGKNCTTCEHDSYLISGQCQSGDKCPENYYLRKLESGNECLPCHHTCHTCNGPGPTSCISCWVNATFRKGICIPCLDDEYFDQDSSFCKHCHPNCGRCFGPAEDQCHSCLAPLKLDVVHSRCLPCCVPGMVKSIECCLCNKDSDNCMNSDDHPRSVHSNSITNYNNLLLSSNNNLERTNIYVAILSVCGSAVLLFFTIFGVLQARSSGWFQYSGWSRHYRRVPEEITTNFDRKMEKVLLTEHEPDDDEDDDIYCKS